MTSPLLSVKDLKIHFNVSQPAASGGRAVLKAVDGVSMDIERGKTLALVGESGCGKSTTGYGILGLASVTSGEIHFDGKPLASMQPKARHDLISNEMQIIFQDPSAALNPKMTIADSIGEPLRIRRWSRADRAKRVAELMEMVGLSATQASRFPNEISGGQRQRVVIARALALSPKLIVCDEPVSALDVSIRSQVLNILMKLQRELNLSYLFISHDLSVVRHIADDVVVMYLGTIVERGRTDDVYGSPRHPYTEALLSAIPLADPVAQRARKKIVLSGEIPSPLAAPSGCPFVTRCPIKIERCWTDRPQLEPTSNGTDVACHLRREQA
ncbi:peptide/nickel transport system ATP-binding protein/oligopeptide transport system ATP-binding protein [Rhizobium skierniewicense]|uniref:Peptide/nickel transport system ATP-binding protein/oligopeptide transport system ATP-binding protein n=1 Tax=Rhizobium skierniewicense TaxID=984260 RepID=A0A7W6G019_9HYPH|nr:oligopeptide/dipeptide ABC transporter ATP-binding protein [Rhizobium skierniewicense]MBB3944257.1 peptide/nickel transport system ATP-binding protein/oligopeptide transport system ATP-binding protein [Rhizobium skierniewicense]NTF33811.1 ATP-binding cassette domain-containing protein [Rhizobium skierniewicense]